MGEKIEGISQIQLFDKVNEEELLEYAVNREKGGIALGKRRYF